MKSILLAVALAAFAATARADDDAMRDAQRADLRCVLGMSVMARNDTYKQWATTGIFFYTGRIEGRDPGINLTAELKREFGRMQASAYNDEIKRCSDQLGEKSRGLEAMKSSFQPRGVGR